jgi:uncharacterized membrane protein (DUF4010 family)
MLEFIDSVVSADIALLRLLVAALLGGLIGVERERSGITDGRQHFAGVRTFPMFSMLGCGLTLTSGAIGLIVTAGFLAVAALVAISYIYSAREDLGVTTEIAALITYWVGVLSGAGALLVSGGLGVGLVVLLASKERLEAFPQTLTREELSAVLTLAVIAAVILPVLPDAQYGPWGVWNPRHLWGIVVIVCGLSFVAFIGMRVWGSARGVYASGLLGGLVSSTAATVSFASRSREEPEYATRAAIGAGLASLVMLLRVGILAAIAGSVVLPRLIPFLAAAIVGGGVGIVAQTRHAGPATAAAPRVANPFHLGEAVRFAALYAIVQLAVEAASRYLGQWGVAGAAVLAGLTDVDAITLTLAGAAARGDMTASAAAGAIALAVCSNTVAKSIYAASFGTLTFRRTTLIVLGAALLAGIAVLFAGAVRP